MLQIYNKYINIIVLLSLLTFPILGQSVDDYFHSASQSYIFGKKDEAKSIIAEAMKKYPDDPKLSALKKLLKEEEEKQNQQNKQNQDQNKDNKQDQNKDNKQDQNKQDQNKDNKQDQNKQDQNKDNKQKDQEKQQQQAQQQPQPQPQDSKEQMKKEEAMRLLLQYSDDAEDLNKPKKKVMILKGKKTEKDW